MSNCCIVCLVLSNMCPQENVQVGLPNGQAKLFPIKYLKIYLEFKEC